jgi:hypothetical protein
MIAMRHYQHKQIGWVNIWLSGGTAVVVALALFASGFTLLAVWLLPLLAIPALLMGSLTVSVTDEYLDARFGPGPINVRVPLSSVRSCQRVRNPWYYGYGIRMIPGGRLYNVSGGDAIELMLDSGRSVRVGTDDPEGLAAALQQRVALGTGTGELPVTSNVVPFVLALVGVVLLAVGWMLYDGLQPVDVVTSNEQITVRGAFYSDTIKAADIVNVSLDPFLPSIATKTNGFNAGQALRGSFRLRDGRRAHLFVERGSPPFVQVRTATDLVFINYKDSSATQALYDRLLLLQGR